MNWNSPIARLVCWWTRRHVWSPWTKLSFSRIRYCNRCPHFETESLSDDSREPIRLVHHGPPRAR